jgi:transposase
MQNFSNFIGIDVSKEKIDVFFSETSSNFTIPNNARAIVKAFQEVDPANAVAVVESTGGYEKACVKTLSKMDFSIHRANNNRVKFFMKGKGIDDKTDKIDAEYLAWYGEEAHRDSKEDQRSKIRKGKTKKKKKLFLIYQEKPALYEEIRQLTLRMTALKQMKTKERNRLKSPGYDTLTESCKAIIAVIEGQIDFIEKRLIELIKSDDGLRKDFELLRQYCGIGDTTAAYLVSCFPELGKIKPKALFVLAGLAPKVKDSGTLSGYRTTKGRGRPFLKQLFFMAALSTVRYNKPIADFYQKKIEEGKPKMVAIVACMRKMVSQLNAILRNGEIKF